MSAAINLQEMLSENKLDNAKLIRDQSPENVKEIYERVKERKSLLRQGYTADMKTPERAEVNKSVDNLLESLKAYMEVQFAPEKELDEEAFAKVSEVRRIINKMTDNGRSEEQTRIAINSLYLKDDRSGLKFIDKDHPEMKKLWAEYYDKQARNYIRVIQDPTVTHDRKLALADKLKKNQGHFKAATVDAMNNILTQLNLN